MNKGEKIHNLLNEVEVIDNRMRHIFLRNGLITTDLSLLSSADRDEWNALYEQHKKITDEIANLINQ